MSGMFTNWDAEHSRQIQHEQQLRRQAAARRKAEISASDWQARAEQAEATLAQIESLVGEAGSGFPYVQTRALREVLKRNSRDAEGDER